MFNGCAFKAIQFLEDNTLFSEIPLTSSLSRRELKSKSKSIYENKHILDALEDVRNCSFMNEPRIVTLIS